jgi:hypothetical protein
MNSYVLLSPATTKARACANYTFIRTNPFKQVSLVLNTRKT